MSKVVNIKDYKNNKECLDKTSLSQEQLTSVMGLVDSLITKNNEDSEIRKR